LASGSVIAPDRRGPGASAARPIHSPHGRSHAGSACRCDGCPAPSACSRTKDERRRRQVSWHKGQCTGVLAFPDPMIQCRRLVGTEWTRPSPLTVTGIAADWRANLATAFPLSPRSHGGTTGANLWAKRGRGARPLRRAGETRGNASCGPSGGATAVQAEHEGREAAERGAGFAGHGGEIGRVLLPPSAGLRARGRLHPDHGGRRLL